MKNDIKILEAKGIKVIDSITNYCYKCIYNNNKIIMELNSGCGYCYRLSINGKTIVTKASFQTCIVKILNY